MNGVVGWRVEQHHVISLPWRHGLLGGNDVCHHQYERLRRLHPRHLALRDAKRRSIHHHRHHPMEIEDWRWRILLINI